MDYITLHTYVDQLIDNTDGKLNDFGDCWFTVPVEWAEKQVKVQGFQSLDDFLVMYTYDDTEDWLALAIKEGVLNGCGAGDMRQY